MKIKLRKTDILFTRLVRATYNYTCQKCGRYYPTDGNIQNLGVSHFWVRNRENTRFDMDNVTLLCSLPCHHYWENEGRKEYEAYMIKRLGQERFDALMLRAHILKKRDDKMDEMIIREQLKQYADVL